MEDAKYIPTVLHTVASEKLNDEVAKDLKQPDPKDISIASILEEQDGKKAN